MIWRLVLLIAVTALFTGLVAFGGSAVTVRVDLPPAGPGEVATAAPSLDFVTWIARAIAAAVCVAVLTAATVIGVWIVRRYGPANR
jgi:hypothetical protein